MGNYRSFVMIDFLFICIICLFSLQSLAQSELIDPLPNKTFSFQFDEILGTENDLVFSQVSNGVMFASQGVNHRTNELLLTKINLDSSITFNFKLEFSDSYSLDFRSANFSDLKIWNDSTLIGIFDEKVYKLDLATRSVLNLNIVATEFSALNITGSDTILFVRSNIFNGVPRYFLETFSIAKKQTLKHIEFFSWPEMFLSVMRNEIVCSNGRYHCAVEVSEPKIHIFNNDLYEIQVLELHDKALKSATDVFKSEKARRRINESGFDGMFSLLKDEGVNKSVNLSFLNDSTICYVGFHFEGDKAISQLFIFQLGSDRIWRQINESQAILNFPVKGSNCQVINLIGSNYFIASDRLVVFENIWNEKLQKMEAKVEIYNFNFD